MAGLLVIILPWPVIAVLLLNMAQRRYLAVGEGKRIATLCIAGLLVLLLGASAAIDHFGMADTFLLVPLAVIGFLAWRFRRVIWPFRLRCSECGSPLPLKRVLFYDEPRCEACAPQDPPSPETDE